MPVQIFGDATARNQRYQTKTRHEDDMRSTDRILLLAMFYRLLTAPLIYSLATRDLLCRQTR